MGIKRIQVCFNDDNKYHLQAYEYVKSLKNSSGYIRDFLIMDMLGKQITFNQTPIIEETDIDIDTTSFG